MATPKKKIIDWEAIEREFRAGQLSVVEIGRQHGVSHTAINKRAARSKWKRDLADRVRTEVSARLAAEEVSEKVSEEVSTETPEVSAAREAEAIEVAAARGVEVVRQHRRDISRYATMSRTLLAELEQGTAENESIAEAIEEETAGDKNGIRRQNMLRAIALPSRANVLKDLAGAAKIFIELERKAFNLDQPDEKPAQDALAALLQNCQGTSFKPVANPDPDEDGE